MAALLPKPQFFFAPLGGACYIFFGKKGFDGLAPKPMGRAGREFASSQNVFKTKVKGVKQ